MRNSQVRKIERKNKKEEEEEERMYFIFSAA